MKKRIMKNKLRPVQVSIMCCFKHYALLKTFKASKKLKKIKIIIKSNLKKKNYENLQNISIMILLEMMDISCTSFIKLNLKQFNYESVIFKTLISQHEEYLIFREFKGLNSKTRAECLSDK